MYVELNALRFFYQGLDFYKNAKFSLRKISFRFLRFRKPEPMNGIRHIGTWLTDSSLFVRKEEKLSNPFLFFFLFLLFFRNTREIVTFILEYLSRAEIVSLRAMFMPDYNPLISRDAFMCNLRSDISRRFADS